MAKSPFVERMDEVQASLTQLLMPLGFRRRGRTFNRSAEEGVVQVINLQMGLPTPSFSKPLPVSLAHLNPDVYGLFAVNLGVHVSEISDCDNSRPLTKPRRIVQEYECQIRVRLEELAERRDFAASLEQPADVLVSAVGRSLVDVGIPFLERFETRAAIIRDWITFNDLERSLSLRARVDVAIMHATAGRVGEARQLLREQVSRSEHRGHVTYVGDLARQLGIGDLNI